MKYLPALILALATTTLAQEPARPEPPQHTPTEEAAPVPGTTAAVKRQQTPARQAADDERFVPSESISEDLSVSFPSDI